MVFALFGISTANTVLLALLAAPPLVALGMVIYEVVRDLFQYFPDF